MIAFPWKSGKEFLYGDYIGGSHACRACTDGVIQAPAPARLIQAGQSTEATVAHVLVSRYADHLPLSRQAQIMSRQGIYLDRSTLADWVGRAAYELRLCSRR